MISQKSPVTFEIIVRTIARQSTALNPKQLRKKGRDPLSRGSLQNEARNIKAAAAWRDNPVNVTLAHCGYNLLSLSFSSYSLFYQFKSETACSLTIYLHLLKSKVIGGIIGDTGRASVPESFREKAASVSDPIRWRDLQPRSHCHRGEQNFQPGPA